MKLSELLKMIIEYRLTGPAEQEIRSLVLDSREASAGALFFAYKGNKLDGHAYIEQAVSSGACVILCEHLPDETSAQVSYIVVKSVPDIMGTIVGIFFDHPSRKLKLVGVTGTNGKTTIATSLYNAVESMGIKAGLLSTIENKVHNTVFATLNTTPDIISINKLLKIMVEEDCEYCFMEVSSHAVDQKRIEGLSFAGGIFTNLTHDHLDYHGTFEHYHDAKKKFFDGLGEDAFAVTNIDDPAGATMVRDTRAEVVTYALDREAVYRGAITRAGLAGMTLAVGDTEIHLHLAGTFNAYNALAIYATMLSLGFAEGETVSALEGVLPVSGRMETILSPGGITGIVDYAHTPDAVRSVLDTIRASGVQGKIITVIGCGGDRDKTKRPIMARDAVSRSDMTVLTSDNPRTEDPEAILADMSAGLAEGDAYLKITDRREAIKKAVAMACPGDVILVAGKGHESYQEIAGVKHHFSDQEILKSFLN